MVGFGALLCFPLGVFGGRGWLICSCFVQFYGRRCWLGRQVRRGVGVLEVLAEISVVVDFTFGHEGEKQRI